MATKTGAALARKRQLLVFDRLLAGSSPLVGDAAILKAGLVLELRIERARSRRGAAICERYGQRTNTRGLARQLGSVVGPILRHSLPSQRSACKPYTVTMDSTVTCPYCGEPTEIEVDDEAGRHSFIQDCEVCCNPIQVRARVTADGEVFVDVDRA